MEYDNDDFERLVKEADQATVDTVDVHADPREVREKLRVDGEFLIEFFLADHLDMPVPEFHKEIWDLLTDQQKERILLAIPRDHAKTTLSKLVVVWYWLFTSHRFCVYLSNTNTIAKDACKDILAYLKSPNFRAVFGDIKIIKESETESKWIFEIPIGNGQRKRCILRALGQGQQTRGINIDNQRPDIAVIDDVEDDENTKSETLQKQLDKWMFGPFLKALARKKKILWLGNMLQKTSLLARLSRMPKWNPVVFGCLIKDAETGTLRPLWEGKWTIQALKEDFQEYKGLGLLETWMCEMMNMPGHGENGFTQEHLNYAILPTPDSISAAWITIDPAFGLKAHNDESAVAVHVLPESGLPMTVACAHGKWTEREMFNQALSLAEYWGAWTWGIEAIAAQRLLITLFTVWFTELKILGRCELVELGGGRLDAKASRIRAWVNLMASGDWAIDENDIDITTQVLSYNTALKEQADDIIDACAYGPMMMDSYLGLIMQQFDGKEKDSEGLVKCGTEVCDV